MAAEPRTTVGLGLVTTQTPPDSGLDPVEPYRAIPRLAWEAERAGFDAFWVSEHHGAEDGYLPSVLVALAAAAAATERIRLGAGVVLAPMHHPLRLAEDANTVHLLSEGRLELGLGLGYRRAEFEAMGVPRTQRGALVGETVEVLRALFEGRSVDHEDVRATLRGASIHPVPDDPPRIWLGGYARPAVERAARLADGYLVGSGPLERVDSLLDVLDPALGGRPIDVGVGLTTVPDDLGISPDHLLRGLEYQLRTYARWMERPQPYRVVPDLAGSCDAIIEALRPLVRRLRPYRSSHLMLRLLVPGLTTDQATTLVAEAGHRLLGPIRELAQES